VLEVILETRSFHRAIKVMQLNEFSAFPECEYEPPGHLHTRRIIRDMLYKSSVLAMRQSIRERVGFIQDWVSSQYAHQLCFSEKPSHGASRILRIGSL